MQVIETRTEGLKREFKVVVNASDIQAKVTDRLEEIGRTARLPGFRPGRVPMPILKKRFGSAVMGEVLERAVSDSSSQAMIERGLRPAVTPKVDITSFAEGKDLEYTLAVELLPDVRPMNFADLALERLKADVTDEEADRGLRRIAEGQRRTERIAEDRPAQKSDILLIDFSGTVDGKALSGMAAQDHKLELGSNQFVAGFEDQLIGRGPGTTADVKVTFPQEYMNKELAGKDAAFTVTVKEIHRAVTVTVDDELAKTMGLDDLDTLKKAVRDQLGREFARMSRQRLKRQLLDRLAAAHDFVVPQGMVDLEFDAIWKTVEAERAQGTSDPSLVGKTDDEIKADFRAIAERRVRLGLLLSEVGRLNIIQVTQEEVNRAILEEARRFPGQERKVAEYFRNSPEALAQLRAPLFEDKVVDFILEIAKVSERTVTSEELAREPEGEPGGLGKS
jgi:trigger factor